MQSIKRERYSAIEKILQSVNEKTRLATEKKASQNIDKEIEEILKEKTDQETGSAIKRALREGTDEEMHSVIERTLRNLDQKAYSIPLFSTNRFFSFDNGDSKKEELGACGEAGCPKHLPGS